MKNWGRKEGEDIHYCQHQYNRLRLLAAASAAHLASIRIRPAVSRRKETRSVMAELEVLVGELVAVNAERPATVAIQKVSSLCDEAVDDAVKE